MMAITINLDCIIKAKLTEHGRAVHFNSFLNVEQHPDHRVPYTPPAVDANGYCSFKMKHWMEIFGRHINSGSKDCFENNEVYVCTDISTIWEQNNE